MKVVRAFTEDKGIRIPAETLHNDIAELISFGTELKNVIIHTNVVIDFSIYNI